MLREIDEDRTGEYNIVFWQAARGIWSQDSGTRPTSMFLQVAPAPAMRVTLLSIT